MRISRIHINKNSKDIKSTLIVSEEKAHYIRNVLRLKKGHQLVFFTNDGQQYTSQINQVERHQVELSDIKISPDVIPPSSLDITIIQGISSSDRMDYTVQKSAEMGAQVLIPVFTEYCSQKIALSKYEKRLKHWQAVANSACEQSGRCDLLRIENIQSLQDVVVSSRENAFFLEPTADLKLNNLSLKHHSSIFSFFIGPEGGFSPKEIKTFIESGIQGVQLGRRILRTETVAPVILAATHALFGDFC